MCLFFSNTAKFGLGDAMIIKVQLVYEVNSKTFAGIFTSKAQEHIIVSSASGRRRRRRGGEGDSFTVQENHWWNQIDKDADLTHSWQCGGGWAAVEDESRSNLANLCQSSRLFK